MVNWTLQSLEEVKGQRTSADRAFTFAFSWRYLVCERVGVETPSRLCKAFITSKDINTS